MRPFERPPVVIRWIAQPDACDDCKQIAAGSPYERLPTWPGLGDTRCAGGACRCAVEGARPGNVMATARTNAPAPEPAATSSAEPVAAQSPEPVAAAPAAPMPTPPPLPASAPRALSVAARLTAPFAMPESRPVKLTAMRMAPLERRWTLALGALIFIAVVVAMAAR